MSGEASNRCLRRLNEIRERERDRWRTHDSLARRNCVVRIPPITNWQVYFSSLSERRRERERERGKVSRAAITIDKLPNDLPPSFSLIPVRRTNFSPVEKLYPTDSQETLSTISLRNFKGTRVIFIAATRSRRNLDPRDRIAAKISRFDRFKDQLDRFFGSGSKNVTFSNTMQRIYTFSNEKLIIIFKKSRHSFLSNSKFDRIIITKCHSTNFRKFRGISLSPLASILPRKRGEVRALSSNTSEGISSEERRGEAR